jgi:hypothetical protein
MFITYCQRLTWIDPPPPPPAEVIVDRAKVNEGIVGMLKEAGRGGSATESKQARSQQKLEALTGTTQEQRMNELIDRYCRFASSLYVPLFGCMAHPTKLYVLYLIVLYWIHQVKKVVHVHVLSRI